MYLFITPSFFPSMNIGGPIVSNLGLLSSLVEYGHKIIVLTTNRNGPSVLNVNHKRINKINVFYFNSFFGHRFSPKLFYNILKYFSNAKFVHVDDVFSFYTIFVLFINIFSKKKIIFSPRGTFIFYVLSKENLTKRLFKIIFLKILFTLVRQQKILTLHFTSYKEMREARRFFKFFGSYLPKNFVVANGFSRDLDTVVRNPVSTNETIRIVSLGRINTKKRLDLGIRSVKLLRDQGYKIEYHIVGNDDDKSNQILLNLIKELNLADTVFLNGPIYGKEKFNFLRSMDIFLLVSKSENFANVVLESISVHLPLVITRNLPWNFLENKTFCSISSATVPSIAKNILKQVETKIKPEDFEDVLLNYSWNRISQLFNKNIQQL